MRKRKPSINHRVSSISSEYDYWMPSIRKGLLLNVPFRFNNKILYSAAGDTDLSFVDVDNDGTYNHWRTGLITDALNDVPRITPEGVFVEPFVLNILWLTDTLDPTLYWTYVNSSRTISTGTAPGGSSDSCLFKETTDDDTHHVQHAISISPWQNQYTFSIHVKRKENSKIGLVMPSEWGGDFDARLGKFDLATGTVISTGASLDDSGIEDIGGGWYRVWITDTSVGSGSRTFAVYHLNDAGDYSYAGVAANGIYLWGVQVQESPYPTSYVHSSFTPASKRIDKVQIDNTGGKHVTAAAGTVILAHTPIYSGADVVETLHTIFDVQDDSASFRGPCVSVNAADDRYHFIYKTDGGVNQCDISSASHKPVHNITKVIAIVWHANDCRMYVNGVLVDSDAIATMASAFKSSIYIGMASDGLSWPDGSKVSHVLSYNRDLVVEETEEIYNRDYKRWMPWL